MWEFMGRGTFVGHVWTCPGLPAVDLLTLLSMQYVLSGITTGAVPANQPISDGEATDRYKSLRRKMADCPSK